MGAPRSRWCPSVSRAAISTVRRRPGPLPGSPNCATHHRLRHLRKNFPNVLTKLFFAPSRVHAGFGYSAPPTSRIAARGISIATAKTSVNAGRHRRTYRQEPGHKGGIGGALMEARHRRREDAPGGRRTCVPAEFPGVVLSAFEHRLDRTARTYLSFISRSSARRSRTDYRRERHRDARSP
jgi:hypothetical protein